MNTIHMFSDYTEMCDLAGRATPFHAYKQYTEKYPALFESIFAYLYMTDINTLQPMIDTCDFNRLLALAKENITNGITETITETVIKTQKLLNFHVDFDLYIGIEMGNLAGTALPVKQGKPYLYIGIDRVIHDGDMEMLVPHEFNHMVRSFALPGINMFDFMERTISEGLGTYGPIAMHKDNATVEVVAKAINLPISTVEKLFTHKAAVLNKVTSEFGLPLTMEKMSAFFTWNESDPAEYPLSGYFAGMCMIKDLIEQGYALSKLTVMPSNELWDIYREGVRNNHA